MTIRFLFTRLTAVTYVPTVIRCDNSNVDNIAVNTLQWQELNIQNLIEEHLWPMETIQTESWLCGTCWKELNNFHNFYIRIKNAHTNFSTIIKNENTNVSQFEITILENSIQKTTADEAKIVIKDELKEKSEESLKDKQNLKAKPKRTNTDLTPSRKKAKTSSSQLNKIQQNSNKAIASSKQNELSILGIDFDSDTNESYILNKIFSEKSLNEERDAFIAEHFKLSCSLCDLPMKTFCALMTHFKEEHDNQKGYAVCCNKKIYRRGHLFDHINQHLDPDYLRCKVCNKISSNSRILKVHTALHEKKVTKDHCCDICGLRFGTLHILRMHKTTHLSEEEKLHTCPECNKNFATEYILRSHIRAVHNSSISCDICGLILVNKSALSRHKSIKHPVGEQSELICPICSKMSANRFSLDNHIKSQHQLDHNQKCTLCDRAFKYARELKRHMATHTGIPLHYCPWCPKTFNSNSNISKHHMKWHPKEYEEEKRKKYCTNNLPLE